MRMTNETANPEPVLDALLPHATTVAGGAVEVRPLTLATFALLDKIRSPLLSGVDTADIIALIPTLYVLSHPAAQCLSEISAGRLESASIEWADRFPPTILSEIRSAAVDQIERILYLIPPPEDGGCKKKETAGYSQS